LKGGECHEADCQEERARKTREIDSKVSKKRLGDRDPLKHTKKPNAELKEAEFPWKGVRLFLLLKGGYPHEKEIIGQRLA